MKDTYRHKGLRKKLITSLRERGIQDEAVLAAIGALPRHFFMDNAFVEWAYQDKAFPIGNEQTISQPFTVAFQTSLLEVRKGDLILEIGTGSGYQTAILALLGAEVYTIERQESLYLSAKSLLETLGISRVHFYYGDGYLGLEQYAPFDKILVTAGAPNIPEALKKQLKIGGYLVIPTGSEVQQMIRLKRLSKSQYQTESFGDFRFVPLLEGLAPKTN